MDMYYEYIQSLILLQLYYLSNNLYIFGVKTFLQLRFFYILSIENYFM